MKKTNYPKSRKPGSGGARQGAGRPKKDLTTRLAYRVPTVIAEPLDKRIREVIQSWKKINPVLCTPVDFVFPPGTKVTARPASELEKIDPNDPFPELSRAIISAHLDKEDKAISKLLKKQKKC